MEHRRIPGRTIGPSQTVKQEKILHDITKHEEWKVLASSKELWCSGLKLVLNLCCCPLMQGYNSKDQKSTLFEDWDLSEARGSELSEVYFLSESFAMFNP